MEITDWLQPAILLHSPVPVTELEKMNLPHYTIRSINDGVDGSRRYWKVYDEG